MLQDNRKNALLLRVCSAASSCVLASSRPTPLGKSASRNLFSPARHCLCLPLVVRPVYAVHIFRHTITAFDSSAPNAYLAGTIGIVNVPAEIPPERVIVFPGDVSAFANSIHCVMCSLYNSHQLLLQPLHGAWPVAVSLRLTLYLEAQLGIRAHVIPF